MNSGAPRVAVDVVRLAARLVSTHPRPAILDPVVRAGLLIDLALAGSLTTSEAGLRVDTSLTGFVPADRLLGEVVRYPDKPLQWWLYHAPVDVHDLAEVLVGQGCWERHGPLRRVRELRPDWRTSTLKRLASADHAPGPQSSQDAATALLVRLLPIKGTGSDRGEAQLIQACGSAEWLIPDLLTELRNRRAVVNAAGRDAQNANAMTYLV